MPFVAVPSVKPGVTVRPPGTARSRVTLKVSASPSVAEASAIVTLGAVESQAAVAATFSGGPVLRPSVAVLASTVTVTSSPSLGVTPSV